MPRFSRVALLASVLAVGARAQTPCRAVVRDLVSPTPAARLGALGNADAWTATGDVMADGAACTGDSSSRSFRHAHVAMVAPVVRLAYAGHLPDARNDGPMWTGRGLNGFVRAGATFDWGYLHATAAPELGWSQNRIFDFFPARNSARSPFASPWYDPPYSADLPSRFGAAPVLQVLPGQTAAWLTVRGLDVGASASAQAWGPGVRGHLLLGSDAPGIPRIFARTTHPVATRAGSFSGTVFMGVLTESPYFDGNASNNLRTITAWTMGWSPGTSGTTVLGLSHLGMRAGSPWRSKANGSAPHGPTDQMNGFYARVRSPGDGFRAWVEIGRAGALPTARRFFTVPYQGIAYLVGVERAVKTNAGTLLLTGEAANLEQPTDVRGTAPQDFYTSSDIAQGWTQRGRVLGDPIGPGGQSQWAAADWVARRWSAGVFFERVRWNEDAFLRTYLPFPNRHDVTIRAGARAGVVYAGQEFSLQVSTGRRLDYQFQNGSYIPGYHTVDIPLPEFRFSITPMVHSHP